jgi:hypothetical protein
MDEQPVQGSPADEIIIRLYRRLLAVLGGTGLSIVALQLLLPVGRTPVWPAVAAFGVGCIWTRDALSRPRPLTYWATAVALPGIVSTIAVGSLLHGNAFIALMTIVVWASPVRALTTSPVRRALSGDDKPRRGLRRRLRDARARLTARPVLQRRPLPVPVS